MQCVGVVDDRWIIYIDERLGYIAINDEKLKVGFFAQDEDAQKFLQKFEESETEEDFIDWFYVNEYDLAMNEHNYHNG